MREKLVALLELQSADHMVRQIEKSIADLPAQLAPLERDVERLSAMLSAEQQKLAELGKWQSSTASVIDSEQEMLRLAKTKLSASKNGKEFNAASREVDSKRKAIADREAEVKKVADAASAAAAVLVTREADVAALREQLLAKQQVLQQDAEALSEKLVAAKRARDIARAAVPADLAKTYDDLATKRGYAVAAVVKGTCQGCYMALPPQLNNTLARLISIESCPRCRRLVYRKELFETEGAPTADKAAGVPAVSS